MRLFIALWPPAPVRDAIAQWQAAWTWPPRAALVRPQNLHMTVHFLGEVAQARLPGLKQALDMPCRPFALDFGQPEVWGGGVAVLRPGSAPSALKGLHARIAVALSTIGLPVEERPYKPHVTLARRAAGATPPPGPALRWDVEGGFALVRTPGGGQDYEVLARFAAG